VWRAARYAIVPLFLLEPTDARDRWITRRLYDPRPDCRVAQEMLLGIGGVRALRLLHPEVTTYHFNEGHAVFAGVELIAAQMETGASFEAAWQAARARIVFTTHTPVPAGNEIHALAEILRLGAGCELVAGELRQLGGDPFNMTVAGLRLARRANAVAERHGRTARAMWAGVRDAAPITHITNGVHVPSWQDPRMPGALGSDEAIEDLRRSLKTDLVAEIERRTAVRLAPDVLTIAVARRAATYKRPDLVLRDAERVGRLLKGRQLQLVFAGKAHPADRTGKAMVTRLVRAIRQWPDAAVFLENYDMGLARLLTRGADVWLNTPRPPLEASGTSGMKAALNGVLHCSTLDGWWPEGCEHGVTGWAIGDGADSEGTEEHDARDHASLFQVIEGEMLPAYADRPRWLAMMRASVAMAAERFSAERMVRDYFSRLYADA
jgi:starch phosphorylase